MRRLLHAANSEVPLDISAVLEAGAVLMWTDDDGETHLTNDPRHVPEKYRKLARSNPDGGLVGSMGAK